MFTGLIKDIGKIAAITQNREGKRFRILSPKLTPEIKIDDSVSVNGVCQTAIEVKNDTFDIQAVHISLEKTTLGQLRPGDSVNLELALRPMDRMGGHFVSGHVNGVISIHKIENQGKNFILSLELPEKFRRYIIPEGSVCLNGISLTVSSVSSNFNQFQVSIIPHTWDNTVLHQLKIGDKLNIEVDILAKYIENLLRHGADRTQV